MWPITEFLARRLGNPRRRELIHALVDRLDARNRSKAFRRITRLVDEGECPPDLAQRLLGIFPEDRAALNEAIERTRARRRQQMAAEREAQERARFRPHLFIRTERARPTQITLFALLGGVDRQLKRPLPGDIADRDPAEQQRLVHEAVAAHIAECGPEREVRFMGRTTGYLYRPRSGERYEVALDGTITEGDRGAFHEPRAAVALR
ncbi:hypothetical protein [Arhodomonas sp. SL1]|uniref:hypothetical protein n=1 Tax=Arhodomonas sp. SL1 TaxID=3425691 RepID=UPI003F880508